MEAWRVFAFSVKHCRELTLDGATRDRPWTSRRWSTAASSLRATICSSARAITLIMPDRALDMGDGWETKRSRRAGPDWVIVKLAATKAQIERIVLDTAHFKGNFPESAAL